MTNAPVSTAQLMQLWESARAAPSCQFGVVILRFAAPELSEEQLLNMSTGARDGLLLRVRLQWFGPLVQSSTPCTSCKLPIEADLDLQQFTPPLTLKAPYSECSYKGKTIRVRGLRVKDEIEYATRGLSGAKATSFILDKVIAKQCFDRQNVLKEIENDPAFFKQIEEHMEIADPWATVWLNLACQECKAEHSLLFDIKDILYNDLQNWFAEIMEQIHILARAYGWSEQEILSLSSQRRLWYCRRVTG